MQDLEPEEVIVVDAEQMGHQKQLPDHIDEVQDFGKCVEDNQIVAEPFPSPE